MTKKINNETKSISRLDIWINKWTRFNWKYYVSDISLSWVYKYFVLLLLFIFLINPIKSITDEYLVDKIVSKVPTNSVIAEILLLIIALYTIIFLISKFARNLMLTPTSLLSIITFYLCYHYYFNQNQYFFYHLSFYPKVDYASIIIIFLLVRCSSYRSFFNSQKSTDARLSFIEDAPSLTNYQDAFGSEGFSLSIAKHINATFTEHAFAIGILGGWGTGKTDFLNRLRKNLDEVGSDNIIVEFNPWKAKSDAIIEEFFKMLSETLKPFGESITAEIRDYSKRILQTGKEVHYRIMDVLINDFGNDDSLQKKYEKINQSIKHSGKKIIILIDDLDRLTSQEVMEVLRIIRNTANFSNTFFIAGMDKKYITQVLTNSKDYAFEDEYLKKIFQLTITLPTINRAIMVKEVAKFIISPTMSSEEQQALRSVLLSLSYNSSDTVNVFSPNLNESHIFENLIGTMRDLKRFSNSFKIAYEILKNNVELSDLFVLELIRSADHDTYDWLRSKRILTFNASSTGQFVIDDSKWTENYNSSQPKKTSEEINHLREAVAYLMNPAGKNARRFSTIRNFYLYFAFQHFNLIKLEEFKEVMLMDENGIYSKFKKWELDKKSGELVAILDVIDSFSTKEEFEKVAKVYLRMENGDYSWLTRATSLIFTNSERNKRQYFENSNEGFKAFLSTIALDKGIDNISKAYLFNQYLRKELNNPGTGILGKKELQTLMVGFLKAELSEANDISKSLSILLHIFDNIDSQTNKITLDDEATRIMEEALLSDNSLFRSYVVKIFRPYYTPYDGLITLEPFIAQIFTDIDKFKQKLKTTSFESEELKILKIELGNRIDDFVKNKQAFEIKDPKNKKAIEKIMKSNGVQLIEQSDLLRSVLE